MRHHQGRANHQWSPRAITFGAVLEIYKIFYIIQKAFMILKHFNLKKKNLLFQ